MVKVFDDDKYDYEPMDLEQNQLHDERSARVMANRVDLKLNSKEYHCPNRDMKLSFY